VLWDERGEWLAQCWELNIDGARFNCVTLELDVVESEEGIRWLVEDVIEEKCSL